MRTSYAEGELLTKEDIGLVFKSRNGVEHRIEEIKKNYISGITKNDIWGNFEFNGESHFFDDFDLVSFVGSDFTEDKKLRKFEFEGYLLEIPSFEPNEFIAVEKAVGHYCMHLLSEKPTEESNNKITSKWKITMKELQND